MSTKNVKKTAQVTTPEVSATETDQQLTIEEEFQSLKIHEHILLVPGMYVGGMETDITNMDVYDSETNKIVNKKINYVPALFKIFDEAMVNTRDQSVKDPSMTEIRVTIDKTDGSISIMNNGNKGMPVKIHNEWQCYVPEGLFTKFMTSGNFHRKNKTIGAKNGYGIKLTFVMSTYAEIEVVDAIEKKKFSMTLKRNMYDKSEPLIENLKGRINPYVKIKFIPDYQRFGMDDGLTDDMIDLFTKRVYDIAATTKVKVFLNDKHINIKSFEEYIKMFYNDNTTLPLIYEVVNDKWQVGVVVDTESGYMQRSYVNGICTYKGGTHVNHVTENVISKLHDIISTKYKDVKIKTGTIKDNLTFFINSIIEDPDFPGQTKEDMTSKVSTFGSRCTISDEFIKKLSKTGIMEQVKNISMAKEQTALKVNNGKKTVNLKGYAKLRDAPNAGTRNAKDCTLILTEGDSAKPFAIAGIENLDSENYGVFPLKGKLLNVREATMNQLKGNDEIKAIIKIMGLKYDMDYKDVNTLRYGRILVLTDQDLDGYHIKGLVMNFIKFYWPSLIKMGKFVTSMRTPILQIWKTTDTKQKNPIPFYSQQEYDEWANNNNTKPYTAPKYYKGLGTSTPEEAARAFLDFEKKIIYYGDDNDEKDSDIIDIVFSSKKPDIEYKKDWLRNYNKDVTIPTDVQYISYNDFVNKELIHFSNYDNVRSIPSINDGLKPSQRKIIFTATKEKLYTKQVRVSELAGFVIGKADYHHGEMSLQKAITSMAQNFVGANNISLLEPWGQFGTRACGGTDASSARYTHTKLNPITSKIFREEDKFILTYNYNDNKKIDPITFCPVICNSLVNGIMGIGTGFSTKVLQYNPIDIINNQKLMLDGKEPIDMLPWYKGFRGKITPMQHKNGTIYYEVSGCVDVIDSNTVVITELPIGYWTDDYKEFLEKITIDDATPNGLIQNVIDDCGVTKIKFTLTFVKGKLQELIKNNNLLDKLDLVRNLNITNMILHDKNGILKKYINVNEILHEYYDYRYGMYEKRKEYYTKVLENKILLIDWKIKFIDHVIAGKIVMSINKQSLKKIQVIEQLEKLKFPLLSNNFDDENKSYDYLTSIGIFDLTDEEKDKLKQKLAECQEEYNNYVNYTIKDLWLNELNEVETEFIKQMDDNDGEEKPKSKGAKGKKVTKKATPKKQPAKK